jgi:hypothetical protein
VSYGGPSEDAVEQVCAGLGRVDHRLIWAGTMLNSATFNHGRSSVTLLQAIQAFEDALAMGQIRHMVLLLDRPDTCPCLRRRERLQGQDGGHAEPRLPKGQCRRTLVTRWRARTRQ